MPESKKIKIDSQLQATRRRLLQQDSSSLSLHHEIAQRLLEHLDGIVIEPEKILILGACDDSLSALLKKRFPKAMLVKSDFVPDFAQGGKKHWFTRNDRFEVCHEPYALAIQDHSIDLVVSNLLLYWLSAHADVLLEMRRVLKPGALCLFSTLGPDTLQELKPSLVEERYQFLDMHDIGDELMRAKFINPVMDMETLQYAYRETSAMSLDLEHWQFQAWLPLSFKDPKLNNLLTFEIVYGHAWGPSMAARSSLTDAGDVAIPITQITRKK